MHIQRKSSRIWLAVSVIVLTIGVIIGVTISTEAIPVVPVTDSAGAVRQLSRIIRVRGVEAAQAFFLKHFFSYSDNHRHYLGHFLGEHVYKTYGMKGIAKCYSNIEFGCIHGFLLTGYMDRGNSFLNEVIVRCSQDMPEGCMHGLGHTFLLVRGYEVTHLRDSIDACLTLNTQMSYREQCVQGVYMEYNDRFLVTGTLADNSFVPRTYNPHNPLAPCDTEPIALQPICYRELVLYWSNVSVITREDMAGFCNQLTGTNRYECYWSLGGLVAGDDAVIEPSLAHCQALAPKDITSCLKGAVMSVAFQSQKPRGEFCPLLPASIVKECGIW